MLTRACVAATVMALALVGPTMCRRLRLRLPRLGERAKDLAVAVALLVATAVVYRELLAGVPPLSVDHNVHLLKVVETEQLLGRGRLVGWSDMEFAGYPHDALYPFAGYLVVAALHALPGVSLPVAYAWTIFLVLLLGVLAVFGAARLHLSRGAGLLAGLFALLDPGGWWVGGHEFTVKVGVWPAAPAASLVLLALALVPAAVRSGSVRRLAVPGLLIGAGVLFHPLALLLALAALPAMALALALEEPRLPLACLTRGGAMVALAALAVCAFWLVPFLLASPFRANLPFPPPRWTETWRLLVDARLLRQPPLWFGVTLCGLLLLAARGDAFSRFAALFAPGAVVLATRECLEMLQLAGGPAGRWALNLQLERLYFLVRPIGFMAAGHALATLFPPALRLVRGGGRRAGAARLAAAGVTALLLVFPRVQILGWPAVAVPQDLSPADRHHLARALDEARVLVEPGQRLALSGNPYDHALLGPAALRGFKVEKLGAVASTTYRTAFDSDSPERLWTPEMLARTGATALLARRAAPAAFAHFPLVGRFGPFELRRVPPAPRVWIDGGPGQASVLSWDDELIRVEVRGAGQGQGGGELRLMLGFYDAWRSADGAQPVPFDWRGQALTSLPARDGVVELAYHKPPREWLGLAISIMALAALAGVRRREKGIRSRPEPRPLGPGREPDHDRGMPAHPPS